MSITLQTIFFFLWHTAYPFISFLYGGSPIAKKQNILFYFTATFFARTLIYLNLNQATKPKLSPLLRHLRVFGCVNYFSFIPVPFASRSVSPMESVAISKQIYTHNLTHLDSLSPLTSSLTRGRNSYCNVDRRQHSTYWFVKPKVLHLINGTRYKSTPLTPANM